MSDYIVDSADLTSVANAIRTKGGTSAQLAFPAGFVSAVQAIPTSGTPTLISKSITENGTYNASSDNADGYSSVTVNVAGGGSGMAISNPPFKMVSGTITLSAAAYTMKILVDPAIINVNQYQLSFCHIIMPDEYWDDYEHNSTYDNRAAGQFTWYPQYYFESSLTAYNRTQTFLSSNANGHSWKSGGTFSRDFDNNGFNIQTAGSSWKFIEGVPYRYALICCKIL